MLRTRVGVLRGGPSGEYEISLQTGKTVLDNLPGEYYEPVDIFIDKKGEWHELTQWHTINAWGKLAELVQKLLKKGQEIIIEGRLVNQSYDTKSGEKRFTTIIEASEFLVLTPKSEK